MVVVWLSIFNPWLIVAVFFICLIGEFSFSLPYLLETIWLFAGYHLGEGNFFIFQILLLELASQSGRQIGANLLYNVGGFASSRLLIFYKKIFSQKETEKTAVFSKFISERLAVLSPFSVALGRLLGLRIPLTLTLAAKQKRKTLSLAVFLSSLIWDNTYLALGIAGNQVALSPLRMLLYSLVGLTLLYLITFSTKKIFKYRASRNN